MPGLYEFKNAFFIGVKPYGVLAHQHNDIANAFCGAWCMGWGAE